ncbi:MAG: hypothetical protein ACXVUL_20305 [Solirubrobacteraceae bacterium]
MVSIQVRSRSVELTRPLALREEWLPVWRRRRIQRLRWEIGAHDVVGAAALEVALADVDSVVLTPTPWRSQKNRKDRSCSASTSPVS